MTVTAKQEFTITMTGEELRDVLGFLSSAHQYHENCKNEFTDRAAEPNADQEYYLSLSRKHAKDAERVIEICRSLPKPA